MDRIAAFWRTLMTPSNFDHDPYGAATNQLSHIALGAVAALTTCIIWSMFTGEMPSRVNVAFGIVGVYMVVIEDLIQGWKGRDSLWDSSFVAWGAAMSMFPAQQVAAHGESITLSFNAELLGWLMIGAFGSLAIYLWPRLKNV